MHEFMTRSFWQIIGELAFKGPVYEMAKTLSQTNQNVYIYSFEYEGARSLFNVFFTQSTAPIAHGEKWQSLEKT